MYHFLQFRPDKKEAWRMYTPEQLQDVSQLPGPPAFKTVLMVDQDPEAVVENEQDPLDVVKYMGPFYLDFDDADDIDGVLDDVREVLNKLTEDLNIPEQFIHCWLSGGKGVHIVISEAVFGLKSATKFLPMIYKEIAETLKVRTMDMSVYSCGRGRMWRCEGVARPGSGTFKVATTPAELFDMDAEMYAVCVASPRPATVISHPGKTVTFPKAENLFKQAKITASKKVRAMKEATSIPLESLKQWEGIPGCVERLITDGDCQTSNWNQAAMQLASYIAARYEKAEEREYMDDLVKPFAENVTSNSRPSVQERIKHVKEQITRAMRGSIKLSAGAFIAAIGTPCRSCPICRSDMASSETEQEEGEGASSYNANTKIKWDSRGYHLVGENGLRQLTTFTFWPTEEAFELVPATLPGGIPGWKESPRIALIGSVVDDEGRTHQGVTISERAWGSKRELIAAFKGLGDSLVYCSDAETQKMLKTVITFARDRAENRELDKMIRTAMCGLIFQRTEKATIPHYVEADGSVTTQGRSPFRFQGNARQCSTVLAAPMPLTNDSELSDTIKALCGINDDVQVALALGWHVACHFREHIQYDEPQFPLLNVSGNAEAGKTSMVVLMSMINGIDYTRAEFMNVETGSLYPLIKYIASSSSIPRLVEEVNPQQLGTKYPQVVGYLKASWNKAPIQRGRIGHDREVSTSDDRATAPIVYTSEQSALVPALKTRSVEVRLSSKSLLNSNYVRNYEKAYEGRYSLMRMARALVTVAMHTSPRALLDIFQSKRSLVASRISARPRWGFQTCLTGLHMLVHTMREYKVEGVDEVRRLEEALIEYLGGKVVEAERGKSTSEVGRVLQTMNEMADEADGSLTKLTAGKDYWRQGDSIYLVLQACLPRYLRYVRAIGASPAITDFTQMRNLLEGEVYFERTETHPTRDHVAVFVLSYEKLLERGTTLNNFVESDADE